MSARLLKSSILIALMVTLAVGAGSCGGGGPDSLSAVLKPGDLSGWNVLLVTIDTARRDRFGCYGHVGAQTATVDSLAAVGLRYDDAVTSSPLTLPSHATVLTGVYPPVHGVHDNGSYALGPELPTLAEALQRQGYATGAFVGAFVLEARFGLSRGFDVYDFDVAPEGYRPQMSDFNERPAGQVTDAALDWLGQQSSDQPFFAWVHYFDPHLPYQSPLADDPSLRGRPYQAEIAYADRQLGRLTDWLRAEGLADRTLVIVTSDHGEALGEHREATHGMFVYDATMRVPLVVSCGGLNQGPGVSREPVGLVDLRTTILSAAGAQDRAMTDGVDLLAPVPADRGIYIETEGPVRMVAAAPLRGLRLPDRKFIQAPMPEYYDLGADPGELHNALATHPTEVAALRDRLRELMSGWDLEAGGTRALSDEEIARLHSLGYVNLTSRRGDGSLPDPKLMIGVLNRGMEAEHLYAQRRYEEAAAKAREVLESCEGCLNAVRVLAFSELRLGNADEAIGLLREFVARNPEVYVVRSLAQALILQEDYAAATEVIGLYAELDPRDGRVAILRGDVLDRQGRTAEALAQYEEALKLDPHRAGPTAQRRIARMEERRGG